MFAFLIYFTDADIATSTVMQTTTVAAESTSAEAATTIATTGYFLLKDISSIKKITVCKLSFYSASA